MSESLSLQAKNHSTLPQINIFSHLEKGKSAGLKFF
jgi:hypothetical protein